MKRPDAAVLRLLLFAGALLAVLIILIVFRSIFMPLLLGLGIAYLFDPAVSWFERRGWRREAGVAALIAILILTITGLVLYIIPAMGDQLDRLQAKLPEYTERLEAQTGPWLDRLEARYPEQFVEIKTRAIEALRQNLPRVMSSVGKAVGTVFTSVLGFVLFLLNLIFIPVFAFYLLVDLNKIKSIGRGLIPLPYKDVVLARLHEVDQAVSSFLRGQLTIALILAAINATGLMLLGVPLGLVIGLLAGLANMIPYMALIVGLAPALLLCWAEHQSLARVVGVALVFGGAQFLEGTVLSPRILSKSVNLHPVAVLLAIIAGGSLFGFFGMLLAVPTVAAVQVFVRHWLKAYRESRIYLGDEKTEGKVEVPEEPPIPGGPNAPPARVAPPVPPEAAPPEAPGAAKPPRKRTRQRKKPPAGS